MQDKFVRSSVGALVGSLVVVGLLFQTQSVIGSDQDAPRENREVDPIETTSQNLVDSNVDGGNAEDKDEFLPLYKVSFEYPPRALERGIEGFVILEFTVTEKGTVEDPEVVDSDPPGIFDRAAIQGAMKYTYRPMVVDGKPVRVEGVKHKIVFEQEDEPSGRVSQKYSDSGVGDAAIVEVGEYLPVEKVRPEYPARALKRGIEGSVTLEFTVTETGSVENPVVVQSDPPGIFDRSAIKAAIELTYPPKVVDGTPIRVEGVSHKFVYSLEDDSNSNESQENSSPNLDSNNSVDLQEYYPIVKTGAVYPKNAALRGIEGEVTVQFTITEKGSVKNIVVLNSYPSRVFDRAAKKAVSQYKYRPRMVDGTPVRVDGVKNKLVFSLEDDPDESEDTMGAEAISGDSVDNRDYLPISKVAPVYPRKAVSNRIEGYVLVSYAVTEKGKVEDVVVLEADPPGVFDTAATKSASKAKYLPRVVDGNPVRVENVKSRIVFKLDD